MQDHLSQISNLIVRQTKSWSSLGEALKDLRQAKGLTQKETASISSKYSERSYRRLEAGTSPPDRNILIKILTESLQERDSATINRFLRLGKKAELTSAELARITASPVPQLTRWGPIDGMNPGICINSCTTGLFIPWAELQIELQKHLLLQVSNLPTQCTLALGEFRGRRNWIVRILSPRGEEIANLWFGPDPHNSWGYDGLVRVGPTKPRPVVWEVFQRYSDGSYRRIEAYREQ